MEVSEPSAVSQGADRVKRLLLAVQLWLVVIVLCAVQFFSDFHNTTPGIGFLKVAW